MPTAIDAQWKIALKQCRGVEKLAELVEEINGIDHAMADNLSNVKKKMKTAIKVVHDTRTEDEIRRWHEDADSTTKK